MNASDAPAHTVPLPSGDLELYEHFRKARDQRAFEELVRRYQVYVFHIAYSRCACRQVAEEIAQEFFLRLAQAPIDLGGLPFRVAIFRMVYGLARDYSRSEERTVNRTRHATYLERARANEPRPESTGEKTAEAETRASLVLALGRLEEAIRLPLMLHFMEGLTQSQIALAIGVSQPLVARRIRHGLEALRQHLIRGGAGIPAATLEGDLKSAGLLEASPGLKASLGTLRVAPRGSSPGHGKALRLASGPAAVPLVAMVLGALLALGVLGWWNWSGKSDVGGATHAFTRDPGGLFAAAMPPVPAADPISPTPPAPAGTPLYRKWTFEHGVPRDLTFLNGYGVWSPPAQDRPAALTLSEKKVILLPIRSTGRPLRVSARFQFLKLGDSSEISVYYCDGRRPYRRKLWSLHPTLTARRPSYQNQTYLLGPHIIALAENKLSFVTQYRNAHPGAQLALQCDNQRLFEIEVQELPESNESLPQALRDIPALIRGTGVEPLEVDGDSQVPDP